MNHTVYTCRYDNWQKNINALLTQSSLPAKLANQSQVIIKPNLVKDLPPPVTTPVELVAAIVDFIKESAVDISIIVADGCGSLDYATWHVFDSMGYTAMAREKGIELVDLNEVESVRIDNPQCNCWPYMYLPKMVFDPFLISVPVLKAHTLAGVTMTMKNMMGLAPPVHYQQNGHWKKAAFHANIHAAVFDLNQYRTPDFTVLDATIGMAESHLWGRHCAPPVNQIAASEDPVAIDAYGCDLLGVNWRDIGYIAMADNVLGKAKSFEIAEVDC